MLGEAKNRHHRGVAGKPAGRLGQQLGETQPVGQFHPGERFQDSHQLLRSAAGLDHHRLEPVALVQHACGPPGGLARADVVVPAFLADAVGGVAAVGHQPDLLVHFVHGVGQRGRGA